MNPRRRHGTNNPTSGRTIRVGTNIGSMKGCVGVAVCLLLRASVSGAVQQAWSVAVCLLLRASVSGAVQQAWGVAVCLLLRASVSGAEQQAFATNGQPKGTAVDLGSNITLTCRVQNKQGPLQWTRDDFGLGTNRSLEGFDRYKMIGSPEEGDWTLDINPVTLEDDAQFQCQVGAAKGVKPIRSQYARLEVRVPPDPPTIANGPLLRTVEGREVDIICVSRRGKPPAVIEWLDGFDKKMKKGEVSVVHQKEGKRTTTTSTLKLKAKKGQHDTNVTCAASNPADTQVRRTSIHLLVEYAPHIKIKQDPKNIVENSNVKFSCEADGNPSAMSYQWYVDDVAVNGNQGTELQISNIGRDRHEKIVKCQVRNKIGKSEQTKTLNVLYGPSFLTTPKSVSSDAGVAVTLVCLVDGNPQPKYTWFRNGDMHTVIGHQSNLTVDISDDTVGKYICRGSVKGFQEISSTAVLFQKGPPRILNKSPSKNEIQVGRSGDTVQVTCRAFSIPPPDKILWTFHGFPVDTNSQHYSLLENKLSDTVQSTLIIKDSIEKDFGDYNCTVKNSYGQDSLIITLEPSESNSLVIILAAVVAGVILTLSAIAIFLHCHKTRHRNEKEAKEDDMEDSGEEGEDEDQWEGTDTLSDQFTNVGDSVTGYSQYTDSRGDVYPSSGSAVNGFSGFSVPPWVSPGHAASVTGNLNGTHGRFSAKFGQFGSQSFRSSPPAMQHINGGMSRKDEEWIHGGRHNNGVEGGRHNNGVKDMWGNGGGIEGLSATIRRNNGGMEGLSGTLGRNNGEMEGLSGTLGRNNGGMEGLSGTLGRNNAGMEGLSGTLGRNNAGMEGLSGTLRRNNEVVEELQREIRGNIGGTEGFVREVRGMEGYGRGAGGTSGGMEGLAREIRAHRGGMEGGMAAHYILSQDAGGGLATHV